MSLRTLMTFALAGLLTSCNCGSGGGDDGGTGGGGTSGSGGGSGGGAGGGSGGGTGGAGGSGGAGGGAGGGTGGAGGGSGGAGGGASCGWEVTLGSTFNDLAFDVVALADQSVVVAGIAGTSIPDSGVLGGAWAFRLDAQGQVLWNRSYGRNASVSDIRVGNDGNLVLAGWATSDAGCTEFHGAAGVRDAWVARVRPSDGELLARTCIGGDDEEEAYATRDVVLPDGGYALHVTGKTDTSSNGDIGPKWGGATLVATDMLNAFWAESDAGRFVSASCQGSLGPDDGRGFLDDGSIVGNTAGNASGDLVGQPIGGFGDIWVARYPNSQPCAQQSCAVTTSRYGGDQPDEVMGALPGNLVYGVTRSDDGGVSCPGAAIGAGQPWIAEWGDAGLVGFRCLTNTGDARVEDAFLAGGNAWIIGSDIAGDGVFADAGFVGAGTGSGRGFVIAVDAATRQNVVRALRVRTADPLQSGALRPDGCLILVGSANQNARVISVPP